MKKRLVTIAMSLVLLTTALGGTAQAAGIPATVIPATESALEFQSTSAPEIRIAVAARVEEEKAEAEAKRRAEEKQKAEDPIYFAHPTLEDILPSMPARPDDSFYDGCGECVTHDSYAGSDAQDGCGECTGGLTTKDPTKCTCKNWTYGWDPCLYKDKACKHSGFYEGSYSVPIPGTCTAMGGVAFYCKDCGRLSWKGVAQNGPRECHWNIAEKKQASTCTKDGYLKQWCKTCGKVFYDYIDLARGHEWGISMLNGAKSCNRCGLPWKGADEDFPTEEDSPNSNIYYEEDLLHDDADLIHGQDGKKKK